MDKKIPGGATAVCIIYSTVPPSRSEDLAKRLLAKDLVACVTISPVRSLYRWRGEACDEGEHLLIMKTRQDLAETVVRTLKSLHPYEVPEICVVPVSGGYQPYLDWVCGQARGP